jgi:hypothetical protein
MSSDEPDHKQQPGRRASDGAQVLVGERVRVVEWRRAFGSRKPLGRPRARYEGIIHAVHLADGVFVVERDEDHKLETVRLDRCEITLLNESPG